MGLPCKELQNANQIYQPSPPLTLHHIHPHPKHTHTHISQVVISETETCSDSLRNMTIYPSVHGWSTWLAVTGYLTASLVCLQGWAFLLHQKKNCQIPLKYFGGKFGQKNPSVKYVACKLPVLMSKALLVQHNKTHQEHSILQC